MNVKNNDIPYIIAIIAVFMLTVIAICAVANVINEQPVTNEYQVYEEMVDELEERKSGTIYYNISKTSGATTSITFGTGESWEVIDTEHYDKMKNIEKIVDEMVKKYL